MTTENYLNIGKNYVLYFHLWFGLDWVLDRSYLDCALWKDSRTLGFVTIFRVNN